MTENDIIAEYIKQNYPHLLKTVEFTFFRFGCTVQSAVKVITDKINGFLWTVPEDEEEASDENEDQSAN